MPRNRDKLKLLMTMEEFQKTPQKIINQKQMPHSIMTTAKKSDIRSFSFINLNEVFMFCLFSNLLSYSTNSSSNLFEENYSSRMQTEASEKKYKRFLDIYESNEKVDRRLKFEMKPYFTTLQKLKE